MTGLNNVRFDEGALGYQFFQKKKWNKPGNLDRRLLSEGRNWDKSNEKEEETGSIGTGWKWGRE